MRDASVPATPEPSATVLLLRDEPCFQVLMVKRHHEIDFATGAMVFPGGETHAGDYNPAWTDHLTSWSDLEADQRGLRIAAIREPFEAVGILLADRLNADEVCDPQVRAEVDAGRIDFLNVVRDLRVRLRLDALTVFAHSITLKGAPKRFDTWFYLVNDPADQVAACCGRETVDAKWVNPAQVLAMAETGERTVIFPTRMNLQLLGEASSASDAVQRAQTRTLATGRPILKSKSDPRGG